MATKKKPGLFTLKRNDIAKEEVRIRCLEIGDWLATNMGIESLKQNVTSDGLFDMMADGILPCRVIEKYFKEVHIKFNPNAAPKSFVARDNVGKFVDACKKLNLKAVFDPTDLIDRKNEKAVLQTMLELSKKCITLGVKPPMMVSYQMECEQIEQQHKDKLADLVDKKEPEPPKPAVSQEEPMPGKKKKDEDKPAPAPLFPLPPLPQVPTPAAPAHAPAPAPAPAVPAPAAAPSVSAPALPPPCESHEPAAPAAAAAPAEAPVAAPEEDDEAEEALEEEDGEKPEEAKAGEPKKEKAKIDVEKYKKVKPSKVPCYRTTHLKYYPIPGDDIDNAIADTVNRYVLTVEIRRVQLVSKSGELIMLKGEYVIGGDWVHVRLIQKTLVVFHQNECYNFLHFCQLKMGFELF